MTTDIIMHPASEGSTFLPVSKRDLELLKEQREVLRAFVQSQLVEAEFTDEAEKQGRYGEGDYGVIPGTKKRSLFKPGAEKFQRLFGLGTRFRATEKTFDLVANYAEFVYVAEVYHLKSGVVIAQCEASANSQETKFKERTKWTVVQAEGKTVRRSTKEETPIAELSNTLRKMAQKRAMIGATILAVGASEYFTQDVLEPEDVAALKKKQQEGPPAEQPPAAPAEQPPECCGKAMMVSKFANKETGNFPWYCVKCRKSKEPGAA